MAIVVEDGTGVANAETYISVADFKAYCTAQGLDYSAYDDDTLIEQALRRATQFLVDNYRFRWKGWRVSSSQALDWPRYEVWIEDTASFLDNDIVPADVVKATAECCFRELSARLSADEERLEKRVKVGPLEIEYADGSTTQGAFPAALRRLAPFCIGGAGMTATLRRT